MNTAIKAPAAMYSPTIFSPIKNPPKLLLGGSLESRHMTISKVQYPPHTRNTRACACKYVQ